MDDHNSKPVWLTYKYTLDSISGKNNNNSSEHKVQLFDFQLYDHLCQVHPIYKIPCQHVHHHLKQKVCHLTNDPSCKKCSKNHELFVDEACLLAHDFGKNTKLFTSQEYHQHRTEKCGNCVGCRTIFPPILATSKPMPNNECSVNGKTFYCNLTDQAFDAATNQFNSLLYHDWSLLREHVRPVKVASLFYICIEHQHFHAPTGLSKHHEKAPCFIQTTACCDQAKLITDFTSSFIVTLTSLVKPKEYLIYDPSIWKNQSVNKFICLIRSLLDPESSLETIDIRYKAFTNASFKTPQLSIYKSGKFSLARTAVTGFETFGLYQTSIMSELIDDDVILIPGVLFDMVESRFDTSLVAVKRDPVFYNTSLAVFRAKRNPDPAVKTFVFPYGWGIPFYQDNDGDKNTVYLLRKQKNGYDYTQSYDYKISKYELVCAHRSKLSLLANSRYSLSENVRYEVYKNGSVFLKDNSFYKQTFNYGPQFMADAGASYLSEEFTAFKQACRQQLGKPELRLLTIHDLISCDKLNDFVNSKSKGNSESIKLFKQSMVTSKTFNDPERMANCINQYNNYSQGNQSLRHHGKEQFIAFYSMQDLITIANLVCLNKKILADLDPYTGLYTYVYTEAALTCFKNDLINLYNSEL